MKKNLVIQLSEKENTLFNCDIRSGNLLGSYMIGRGLSQSFCNVTFIQYLGQISSQEISAAFQTQRNNGEISVHLIAGSGHKAFCIPQSGNLKQSSLTALCNTKGIIKPLENLST